jgi:adenylate cyclase class IV|tara:strand:+ start:739 stop:957 length:219 start_codon:yes stop_codon:yes gene_type:complete
MVAYTHIVNGKVIPFTDKEKTEWDIKMAKLKEETKTREDAEAQAKIDKANAKTKLKDLGLSEEEIKALIGEL